MLQRIFRNCDAFIKDEMNGNAQYVSDSVALSVRFHVAKCHHREGQIVRNSDVVCRLVTNL
jgi:hypothetical protein